MLFEFIFVDLFGWPCHTSSNILSRRGHETGFIVDTLQCLTFKLMTCQLILIQIFAFLFDNLTLFNAMWSNEGNCLNENVCHHL